MESSAPPFRLDCSHQANNNEGTPAADTAMPQQANRSRLSRVDMVRSAAQGMIIDSIHPSSSLRHHAAAQELVWPPRSSSATSPSLSSSSPQSSGRLVDVLGQALQIMNNRNTTAVAPPGDQRSGNQTTSSANQPSF